MKEIDFIKKCCEFAEGFEVNKFGPSEHEVKVANRTTCRIRKHYPAWETVYYPLLLQRAIEGVNSSKTIDYEIDMFDGLLEVCKGELSLIMYNQITSIDETKRKALEYVFERMEE